MQRSARCIPERTPPGLHIRNPPPDDTLSPVSESRRPTRRAAAFKHRNSALFQQVFEQDRRPTPDGRTALSTGREAAIHDTNGNRRPPSGIGPAILRIRLAFGEVRYIHARRNGPPIRPTALRTLTTEQYRVVPDASGFLRPGRFPT